MRKMINGVWTEISWQEEYAEKAAAEGWKALSSLEEKYPNDDKRINILTHKMLFQNGETDFTKVLWRMSSGSFSKAFNIAQQIVGFGWGYELSLIDFEISCAEITDGCEVEWLTE